MGRIGRERRRDGDLVAEADGRGFDGKALYGDRGAIIRAATRST